MPQHYPTIELNQNAAREVWPHRAQRYAGFGWKVIETLIDPDRIRHIVSAKEAAHVYAAKAARLNEKYGRGRSLFRASSVYQ